MFTVGWIWQALGGLSEDSVLVCTNFAWVSRGGIVGGTLALEERTRRDKELNSYNHVH